MTNMIPLGIPLHRLLKRREAAALLEEFAALLPGGDLALTGADGHLFVGTNAWTRAELVELLTQASDGQLVYAGGLVLQPLLIKSQLLGALVARDEEGKDGRVKYALRCLYRSLMLLLSQALETRDLARETLDRYREINLLYNVGETIGGCLDPEEIPQLVLGEARRIIDAEGGLVLLPPSLTAGEGDLEVRASFGPASSIQTLSRVCRYVADQVYLTSRPAIVTSLPGDPLRVGPILCAPLKTRERVLGVILLGRLAGEQVFTAGDEKLLMALAGQAAIALETARLHQEEIKQQRMEEELAIARQIQLSLLPEACPVVPGWEFAAAYQPARVVGGDLYDFLELPGEPRQLGLVIADVTDKGVPAALFMAFSRTIVRTEAMSSRNRNPAATLSRANRSIVRDIQSDSRLFLSAFYATLDTVSGRLAYANGGHIWPLWLRSASGGIQPLAARGIVLGVFSDIELEEREIEVAPGDLLVFYTDGITEARGADGQMFDEERLRAAVASNPEASAQQVLQAIIEAVEAFVGDIPQSDDLTLFVIKRIRS
ncbi:MAG: SpoIIE family protein phosphatase [Anaerolineae bacterium]|jgi:serine phosphatase RsbU (regulator of sigma subunit)